MSSCNTILQYVPCYLRIRHAAPEISQIEPLQTTQNECSGGGSVNRGLPRYHLCRLVPTGPTTPEDKQTAWPTTQNSPHDKVTEHCRLQQPRIPRLLDIYLTPNRVSEAPTARPNPSRSKHCYAAGQMGAVFALALRRCTPYCVAPQRHRPTLHDATVNK